MIHATTTIKINPNIINFLDVEIKEKSVYFFITFSDKDWNIDVGVISYPLDKPLVECVNFTPIDNIDDAISKVIWAYNTKWFYN